MIQDRRRNGFMELVGLNRILLQAKPLYLGAKGSREILICPLYRTPYAKTFKTFQVHVLFVLLDCSLILVMIIPTKDIIVIRNSFLHSFCVEP